MQNDKTPLWEINKKNKPALFSIKNNNETTKQKLNLSEPIYFFAFILFCVKYTFEYSEILKNNNRLDIILVGVTAAIPVLKIVLQRYSPIRLAITAIVSVLLIYSTLTGREYHFLYSLLFILALQDIDFMKLIKLNFNIKLFSILIHVLWYIVLNFVNPGSINYTYRVGGEPRHYFLMGHANMFTAFLIWTCFEYIYINYEKINLIHIVVIWIINISFFLFTDSNTGMVVLVVFTIFITMDKLGKGLFDKTINFISKYSYLFLATVFSFLAVIYNKLGPALKDIWLKFDSLMTGRMRYGAYVYDTYGSTFFGRRIIIPLKIFWEGKWFDGSYYFDNYYLGNLVLYGIFNMVVISAIMIIISRKTEIRDKIILIVFSIYGVMEAYVTNVFICFALLIVGKYIYLNTDKNKIQGMDVDK